eukprot:CAMPEP_0117763680 /NCGR_PEP_ID=MMETSP0947-20121206/18836_1 /TAXON_ID=44440 /ORGANISM="Chattonella subsalsa, Strain CCMP2191" /LENGTH=512 /DNA_ID=CAMNT_0005585541 /DNA_START=92 /DNA_END=1627 /DNA_ORIENTATION=-
MIFGDFSLDELEEEEQEVPVMFGDFSLEEVTEIEDKSTDTEKVQSREQFLSDQNPHDDVVPSPQAPAADPSMDGAPPPADGPTSSWAALVTPPAPPVGPVDQRQFNQATATEEAPSQPSAPATLHQALTVEEGETLVRTLSGLEEQEGGGAANGFLGEAPGRMHRGIVNTGNSCFRSVILQSLLACKPFMRAMSRLVPILLKVPDVFPVWAQLASLTKQFEMPTLAEQQAVSQRRRRQGGPGGQPQAINPDHHMGQLCQAFRTTVTTTQEDAQEFLDFLLNQLHEEALSGCRKLSGASDQSEEKKENIVSQEALHEQEEQNGWCEVGKGREKAVINNPTSNEGKNRTLISNIFHGTLRSDLKKGGTSQISATLQPFQCIQLDIRNPSISRIEDALSAFFTEEPIDGLRSEKNNQKVNALKQYTFEALPSVLILHLKRFCYDPIEGPMKVSKIVTFPSQLNIPTRVLSPKLKGLSQVGEKSNAYSLFSAVFHHGQYISSGHYTSFSSDDMDKW